MYSNDRILWIIAQERQQDRLREANNRRMIRLAQENKQTRSISWRRLTWRFGGLMITWGHELQVRLGPKGI